MVSSFDNLPFEIQTIVYENLENETTTIKNCMLVCHSWKRTYQQLFYNSVTLHDFQNVIALLDSFKKNQYLGIIVKRLKLNFYNDREELFESLHISELFNYLPNLECFDGSEGLFCRFLLDALAFNRLPNLTQVIPPGSLDEVHDYIVCAILMRDRLKNLYISELYEEYEGRREVRKRDPVRFYRLFQVLNEFKNLKELTLQKRSENIIQFIDNAINNCPTLRKLTVFNRENSNKIDPTGVTISDYIPVYHVKHLEVYASIADNSLLLQYIMHTFPQLEQLKMVDQKEQDSYLDEITLNKLSKYLSKIKDTTLDIRWNMETVGNWIGPFCKSISQSHSLSVEFTYTSNASELNKMDLAIKGGLASIKIYQDHSMSEDYEKSAPADFIRKYGCYVDRFAIYGTSPSSYTTSRPPSLYEVPIHKLIKNCVRLKQLLLYQCDIEESNYLDDKPVEKRKIDSLRLLSCDGVTNSVYDEIAGYYYCIKHLELGLRLFMDINMAGTDIGTLKLMKWQITRRTYEPVLLVKLVIKESYRYYKYDFDSMRDLVLKVLTEEEYNNECIGCPKSQSIPINLLNINKDNSTSTMPTFDGNYPIRDVTSRGQRERSIINIGCRSLKKLVIVNLQSTLSLKVE